MFSWKRMFHRLHTGVSPRMLTLVLALAMIAAGVSGGTLAWLYGVAPEVRNTFTVGDVIIDLVETDTESDGDNDPNTNAYEMGVGAVIDKDPTVLFSAGSAASWLFVVIDESANFADFMEYALADGWQPLPDVQGVYWRAAEESAQTQAFPVLLDNQVVVKPTVTQEMLSALTSAEYPTLTFTAYAVQRDSAVEQISTPEGAWAIIQPEVANR